VKLTWKDVSSYSQGSRGKIEPTSWEAEIGDLRLIVHRLHGIQGTWFWSCHDVRVDRQELDAQEAGDAQREAFNALTETVRGMAVAVGLLKKKR